MKQLKDNWAILLFAIGLMTALALVGCGTQKFDRWRMNKSLKKAERIADYHGWKIEDTINVTFRDTIYFETVLFDTTTKIVRQDTHTIVNNERMRAVYFYDTLTREIWHEIECKGDTVYTEKTVVVPVDKIQHVKHPVWIYPLIMLIGLIVLCLVLYFIVKKNR